MTPLGDDILEYAFRHFCFKCQGFWNLDLGWDGSVQISKTQGQWKGLLPRRYCYTTLTTLFRVLVSFSSRRSRISKKIFNIIPQKYVYIKIWHTSSAHILRLRPRWFTCAAFRVRPCFLISDSHQGMEARSVKIDLQIFWSLNPDQLFLLSTAYFWLAARWATLLYTSWETTESALLLFFTPSILCCGIEGFGSESSSCH